MVAPDLSASGLSPRTRGNLFDYGRSDDGWRSIPANAGEPFDSEVRPQHRGVYPRERGGTRWRSGRARNSRGLSPRTRGNRHADHGEIASVGSIPANAGEPVGQIRIGAEGRVYPRERGGTRVRTCAAECAGGLSPRTRGNLLGRYGLVPKVGSIPANAGEPCRNARPNSRRRVYPRERGGTGRMTPCFVASSGLSPRTRGNPGAVQREGI